MNTDATNRIEVFVARLDERLNTLSTSVGDIRETQRRHEEKLDDIRDLTSAVEAEVRAQKEVQRSQAEALAAESKRLDDAVSRIEELDRLERDREVTQAKRDGRYELVNGTIGLVGGGGGTIFVLLVVLAIAAWQPDLLPYVMQWAFGIQAGSPPADPAP